MMWMRLWACSSKGFYLVEIPKAPLVRAFLPDAYDSVGVWGRRCWGALFVCLWVVLSGAVFLVLDGALVEGEANGVNAIAKIRRRIETFAGKYVA